MSKDKKKNNIKRKEESKQSEEKKEKITPVVNYFRYKDKCEELDNAIKNPNEKNIAVTGIYGSGKSSLIKTYEKVFNNKNAQKVLKENDEQISKIFSNKESDNDENKDNHCQDLEEEINEKFDKLNVKSKNKSLTISLANFNICNTKSISKNSKQKDKDDTTSSNSNIMDEKDIILSELNHLSNLGEGHNSDDDFVDDTEIEKSLLQQFLFKESSRKLYDSRVNRVAHTLRYKIPCYIFFILSVIFAGIFIINKTSVLWKYNRAVEIVFVSLFALVFLTLLSLIPIILKLKSLSIDKVEINIEDNEKRQPESLINRYLDEIIYFFNKTSYSIVYFEDLDRLPNLKIFNKLRELNFILNNTNNIKRKITFVYCVSDSIITNYEERAKFFDKIISVIPYTTVNTVKKDIEDCLKKCKLESNATDREIINEYADNMARFVNDARLINYVKNDFVDMLNKYKQQYSIISVNEIIKMFTLSIYKNYYYDDYNKVSKNNSLLSKTFKLINYYKKEKVQELKSKIEELEIKLRDSKLDDYADSQVLRERIAGVHNMLKSQHRYSYDSFDILTCSFDEFKEGNYFRIGNNNSNYDSLDFSKINDYFIKKYKINLQKLIANVLLRFDEEAIKIRRDIDNYRTNLNLINNYRISEFLSIYNCFNTTNEFFKICFEKGYIENDYMKFLFLGDASFLLEQDDSFVRYVEFGETNSPIKDNYFYKLSDDKLNIIFNKISTDRYLSDKILNFDFIKYIFEHQKEYIGLKKFENLMTLLSSGSEKVRNFYKEWFVHQDIDACRLIVLPMINSLEMLNSFYEISRNIESEKYYSLLQAFLNNFESKKLDSYNKLNLSKIFNDVENWGLIDFDDKIINQLEPLGNVLLKNIKTINNQQDAIINKNLFAVNFENINHILSKVKGDIKSTAIIQTLLSDKEFICNKNHFLSFLDNLIYCYENQIVNESVAIEILTSNISNENKVLFINKVDFKVKEISSIDTIYLSELVTNDRLTYDIKTIFIAYKTVGFNLIAKYFSKDNYEKIKFEEFEYIEKDPQMSKFKDEMLNSVHLQENNLEMFKICKLPNFNIGYEIVYTEVADSNLARLIDNNKVVCSPANFNNIRNLPISYVAMVGNNIDKFIEYFNNKQIVLTDEVIDVLKKLKRSKKFSKLKEIKLK